MSALRALSTRARITSTSFVNSYEWGDFKGNPAALMEKCFDAFLYLANWGARKVMLRIPGPVFDLKLVSHYLGGRHASAKAKGENVVLEFWSDDESGGDWVDGDGWMPALITVRADLIRGDLRALYLGWLLDVQAGGIEDDALEPPVPAGLGELTGSLKSLADFLRIDDDLIEVAAQGSARLGAPADVKELEAWVRDLPQADKDSLLMRLLGGEERHLSAELLRRFKRGRGGVSKFSDPPAKRRTAAALRSAAERLSEEKRRKAQELEAQERKRRELQAAENRAIYLDKLAQRESTVWRDVEGLVGSLRPLDYDRAVGLLVDLRDLAARKGQAEEFQDRLEGLREHCSKRPSLLRRLDKAGLKPSQCIMGGR